MKNFFIIFFVFFMSISEIVNAGTMYWGYDKTKDKIDIGEGEKNNKEATIAGIIQKVYLDKDNIIRLEILADYNKEYITAIVPEWCFDYHTIAREGESHKSITNELLNWLIKRKEEEAVTAFRINEDGSAEVEYKDYNRKRPIYYYDEEAKKIYVSLNFPNDTLKPQKIDPNSPARQIINSNPSLKAFQEEADKHTTSYFSGRIKSIDITKDRNIKLVVQTAKNKFYSGTIYIYTFHGDKTVSTVQNRSVDYIFNKIQECVSEFEKKGTIANFKIEDDDQLTIACKKDDTGWFDPIYPIVENKDDPSKELVGIKLFEDMQK